MEFRAQNLGLIGLWLAWTIGVHAAGAFDLQVVNHRVTLQAKEVPLIDILQAEYPGIDLGGAPEKTITWSCEDLPVDVFLEKLGVNFAAFFDAEGNPFAFWTLGNADGPGPTLDPQLMQEILKHIDNLRTGDVRFNASSSLWKLVDLGGDAIPYLEQALQSEDYQLSQFAAEVLADLGTNTPRNSTEGV